MADGITTTTSLMHNLQKLGVTRGDGLFVHASLGAVGNVSGGAASVVKALFGAVGSNGLLAMPGFSTDAYFPAGIDRNQCSGAEIKQIELAVSGFDQQRSNASGMGLIAEAFRTWPGTLRSRHPTTSICINGLGAEEFAALHPLDWAMGPDSPLGKLRDRPQMKGLLIGVGWNRCTALHTAETLAQHRRQKIRRFKSGPDNAAWLETLDVADDLGRLFPAAGQAFEDTGAVKTGKLGHADCRLFDYGALILFARDWINAANEESGNTA